MQVFRELFIHGEPAQLAATAEAISASLSGDWTRDAEAEERMRGLAIRDEAVAHCFQCKKRGDRPTTTLFLTEKDKKTYHVANIVPHDRGSLSHTEYNGIIEEFFTHLVQPAAARTGTRAELTDADADLERWLSADTAQKLRRFCRHANKRTGANHPADRKLWNDFILSAHRDGANFPASTLARWLREAGGWEEEWTQELAGEYEHSRGLLEQAAQPVGV